MIPQELALILVGLVVGVGVAWVAAGLRHRRGLVRLQTEADAVAGQLGALQAERARLEERARLLQENLDKVGAELNRERSSVLELRENLSRTQADSSALGERLEGQRQDLEQMHKALTEQFHSIATRILNDNSQLIQLQHKQRLEDVLNPLKERIHNFEQKVDETRREAIRDSQSLKEQIASLHKLNQTIGEEAKSLTTALKGQTKTQGNWGEMILENLLEKSGLQRGREYTVQEAIVTESGRRFQPDVIIHLPERKKIVIDSKVSLTAYERYCTAEDDLARSAELREHIASLRRHVKELGAKSYQNVEELLSLDFVLLFIPIEPAFSLGVGADPGLFNEALEKNIVLVTPSTLLATLKTIANMWKQEKQNRNAVEIARESGALYDKFIGFVKDLLDVGNRMKQAQSSYEDAMQKLTLGSGNLVSRAEHIRNLGAKTSKSMPQTLLDRVDHEEQISLPEEGSS